MSKCLKHGLIEEYAYNFLLLIRNWPQFCQGIEVIVPLSYVRSMSRIVTPSVTEAALSKLAQLFQFILILQAPNTASYSPQYSYSLYWSRKRVANSAASLVMSWRAKTTRKTKLCLGDYQNVSGKGVWKPGWRHETVQVPITYRS